VCRIATNFGRYCGRTRIRTTAMCINMWITNDKGTGNDFVFISFRLYTVIPQEVHPFCTRMFFVKSSISFLKSDFFSISPFMVWQAWITVL